MTTDLDHAIRWPKTRLFPLWLGLLVIPHLVAAPALAVEIPGLEVRIGPGDRTVVAGASIIYEATVVHGGAQALTRESATGGVGLNVAVPKGFTLDAAEARVVLASGVEVGARFRQAADGQYQIQQDRDGAPLTMNLLPGQGLRFRFALRATTRVKPMSVVELGVSVGDARGVSISPAVKARIRVDAQPEFDLGYVLGTVYCDTNENGARDADEPGLGGVRLVSDTGRAVDTDRDGRWHIRDLRAGAHLVKLDVNTLPPQAGLLGSPRALLDVTPGLPKSSDFRASCHWVAAKPDKVAAPSPKDSPLVKTPSSETPVHASEAGWVTIHGDVEQLAASVGPLSVTPARVRLLATVAAVAKPTPGPFNLPWSPRGLIQPIGLNIRVEGDRGADAPKVTRWEIVISRRDGLRATPLRVYTGGGVLPEVIVWDGKETEGGATPPQGTLYEVRATVARKGQDFRDVLTSAPVLVGVGWVLGKEPADFKSMASEMLTGDYFDAEGNPRPTLDRAIRTLKPLFEAHPDAAVLIEVDSPAGTSPDLDALQSGRRAYTLSEAVRRLFGVSSNRVATVGHGSSRASGPARTQADRAKQRRVTITLYPAAPADAMVVPPAPVYEPSVFLDGREVAAGTEGVFGTLAPAGREVGLSMTTTEDARRELYMKATRDAEFEAAAVATIETDPLVNFGGEPLRSALGPAAIAKDAMAKVTSTAGQLELQLPAKGSELQAPRLFIRGQTHPDNVVTVAGQRVYVGADGSIAQLVAVPSDTKELLIESRDKAGNVATLAWPLRVSTTEFFLLALADASGGQAGARLTELTHYDAWKNNDLFVAGRGALYAKGRVSGAVLGKELRFEAHVDSTKRSGFDPFFQQIVDPARDYVVFGDGTDDLIAANTRGPLFVLIEVDRSKVGWGSFNTDMRGLHLFRYERTFDGAHTDIDFAAAKGWQTKVKAFASAENRKLIRRYDEMRATGGSLYYLSSKHIARGSERVDLVLRELDTNMELGRARLQRDQHYRVDYSSGRIMTEAPIPSVVDAFFSIDGYQPFGGHAILDGHQVWVIVSYEMDAAESGGDIAWGVQGTQEIAGIVEIGAGIVREGRPAGAGGSDPSYMQWGVHAKVKATENSFVGVEFARSRAKEGVSFRSTDGGLRYDDLDRATNADAGYGVFATLQVEVAELAGLEKTDLDLQVRGHWQLLQPGFRTAGLAHEEATEKWGGEAIWKPTEASSLRLRYDGSTILLDPAPDSTDLNSRAIIRNRLNARYDHRLNVAWALHGEASIGQHRDDAIVDEVPTTGAVSIGIRWTPLSRLVLSLSQDTLYGGDDRVLGDGALSRLQTNVGAELGITDETAFRVVETFRWNGDNATRIGLINRAPDGSRSYLENRIQRGDRNGRLIQSTVLGAETPWGGADGRAFGEYRLGGGVGGRTNRAVLGLGRAFEIAPGVRTTLAYERSQALDAPGGSGRGARDVLSGGLQILAYDRLKLNGIFEVRWDRDRPAEAASEAFQSVARVNADFKLSDDFTVIGLLDYGLTQNLESRAVIAENLVGTLGVVWRPLTHNDLLLALRWSRVIQREGLSTVDLFGEDHSFTTREDSDLLSLGVIVELPWRFQLTEKAVWRRTGQRTSDGGLIANSDALLWINRLAFHIYEGLDFAGEFRALLSLYGKVIEQNSGLVEVSYVIADAARLGVGWNINGLAGGVLPGEQMNDIKNGFFLRISGMY